MLIEHAADVSSFCSVHVINRCHVLCRLEDHEKERMRIVHENDNLKQKLRALCEQYEARDSHFSQQVGAKFNNLLLLQPYV